MEQYVGVHGAVDDEWWGRLRRPGGGTRTCLSMQDCANTCTALQRVVPLAHFILLPSWVMFMRLFALQRVAPLAHLYLVGSVVR